MQHGAASHLPRRRGLLSAEPVIDSYKELLLDLEAWNGQAWVSALRPKRCLLAMNGKLRDIVAGKLILEWSPEQISGWLKIEYPNDGRMRVSHETFCNLFVQTRGVLKKELMGYLRARRRRREAYGVAPI